MQQILVYADSLSWGIVPLTRERLPFDARWPGVMENRLNANGAAVRVVEDCLNGRRTAWEDPFKPGRNGLVGIEQRIEAHSPLAMVIVMLGTNDFQSAHQNTAWHSAQALAAVIRAIDRSPIEPGMPKPKILIVAPPALRAPVGQPIAPKFEGGPERCVGVAAAFADVAAESGCRFFDAGSVVSSSPIDGVHLDAEEHGRLGRAIAGVVAETLAAT